MSSMLYTTLPSCNIYIKGILVAISFHLAFPSFPETLFAYNPKFVRRKFDFQIRKMATRMENSLSKTLKMSA